jgi:hypothetical protein
MRFQVLTVVSMKMSVFWDDAQCNLVKLTDVSEAFTAVSTSTRLHGATSHRTFPPLNYLYCSSFTIIIRTLHPVNLFHSDFFPTMQVAHSELFSAKLHKFGMLSPKTRKPKIKVGGFH